MTAALIDAWPSDARGIWEVGCGTGVIGLHLLKLTSCREALLTDVDPRAVEHTRRNARRLELTNLSLRVESFPPASSQREPYDLLVCNPPYFPPGFVGGRELHRQVTDELSLTRALLEEGLRYAKRVVISYSSVLLDDVTRYVNALAPARAEWRVLCKVRLPLTVKLANPALASTDGVFSDGCDPRFAVWHDFYVGELRHPSVAAPDRVSKVSVP